MKAIILLRIAMVLSFESSAIALDNVKYYAGTSVLNVAATGEQYPSERITVKRTVSQVNSWIVEIACVVGAGGKYRQSPAYMAVNGNRITVADNQDMQPGLVEGTGFVL